MRRMVSRCAAVIVGPLLFLLLLAPSPAYAHALLLREQPNSGAVTPREPRVIHLWFSENLNTSLSRAVVWNVRRRRVDAGRDVITHNRELTVGLKPGLPPGTYLVLWTSVSSQDGHVLKGAYLFSIIHRGPAPIAPGLGGATEDFPPGVTGTVTVLARAVELGASAFWLALALFLLVIIPGRARENSAFSAQASRRAQLLLPVALVLAILARLTTMAIQAYSLTGSWSSAFSTATLRGLLLETEFGHLWMAEQGVAIVSLVMAGAWALGGPAGRTAPEKPASRPGLTAYSLVVPFPVYMFRWRSWAGPLLLLACAGAFLEAASGHAATVDLAHTGTGITTTPVLIDFLHVLATGVWVGGIFTVAWALVPAVRSRSTPSGWTPFLDTLDRFSPFAYGSVLVLIFTGGFNGKVHVPSWVAFFNAVYGRALIVKILLVMLMVLISAFTVGLVRPRLRRRLAAGSDVTAVAYLGGVLSRWLQVSAVAGCAVFLATAVLNYYPVPLTFGANSGPFTMSTVVKGLDVSLRLSPGKAGPNTFSVHLKEHGAPVKLAEVRILETMLDMNMGTQYVIFNQRGPGLFVGHGQVAMGGNWQFETLIRLPGRKYLTAAYFRPTIAQ